MPILRSAVGDRSRSRLWCGLAGITLALGGGGELRAAAADAEPGVAAVGWWTRSPAASAPEGGFAVGLAPDGPTTVAAIRLALGAGSTAVELRAAEAGGVAQGLASVRVCAVTDEWAPAAGGALGDAPEADCTRGGAAFERDSAGVWTADLTDLTRRAQGEVSVALVPLAASDGALPLFYDIGFAPPEVSGERAVGKSSTPSPTPERVPAPAQVTPAAPAPQDNAGFFTPLVEPAAEANVAAGPLPAGGAQPMSPSLTVPDTSTVAMHTVWHWGKGVLYVALATAAGVGAGSLRWLTTSRRSRSAVRRESSPA